MTYTKKQILPALHKSGKVKNPDMPNVEDQNYAATILKYGNLALPFPQLETTAKTIVAAINELYAKPSGGTTVIPNPDLYTQGGISTENGYIIITEDGYTIATEDGGGVTPAPTKGDLYALEIHGQGDKDGIYTIVTANPEGSATATLNKIKFNNTIYSIQGGGGTTYNEGRGIFFTKQTTENFKTVAPGYMGQSYTECTLSSIPMRGTITVTCEPTTGTYVNYYYYSDRNVVQVNCRENVPANTPITITYASKGSQGNIINAEVGMIDTDPEGYSSTSFKSNTTDYVNDWSSVFTPGVPGNWVYASRDNFGEGNLICNITIIGYTKFTVYVKQDDVNNNDYEYVLLSQPNQDVDFNYIGNNAKNFKGQTTSDYTSYTYDFSNNFYARVGYNVIQIAFKKVDGCSSTSRARFYFEGSEPYCSGQGEIFNGYPGDSVRNYAPGYGAHAEGQNSTIALGQYSHAEGDNTFAAGSYAHSEGAFTKAIGTQSAHAEGYESVASGSGSSHAEGYQTLASGNNSHAEGQNTIASGRVTSHAEGYQTTASGDNSHSEGKNTTASGNRSHAEGGENTVASGESSHAEGNTTVASGSGAHSEGKYNVASGAASHAEGEYTEARQENSHTEGWYTISAGRAQHVFGRYNIEDTSTPDSEGYRQYVEIVGNGDPDTGVRSNARTLDWEGNEYVAGRITVGLAPLSGMDVATKKYVDDHSGGGGGIPSIKAGTGIAAELFNQMDEYNESTASGDYSHAEGISSTASGNFSHAEGSGTTASGDGSHAEGYSTTASGNHSHSEGNGNIASGLGSHAEGYSLFTGPNTASGISSHAEGGGNSVRGNASHAEGTRNVTIGESTHAEGSGHIVVGRESHAEGSGNIVGGDSGHSEGAGNQNVSLCSHIEGSGNRNVEYATFSHTEGCGNVNYGVQAHIEGGGNTVSGNHSHVEGAGNQAHGEKNHTEGGGNFVYAYGSHIEGKHNEAYGVAIHVEGRENIVGSTTRVPSFVYGTSYAVGDIVGVNAIYAPDTQEYDTTYLYRCITAPGQIQDGANVTIITPSSWSSSTSYPAGSVVKYEFRQYSNYFTRYYYCSTNVAAGEEPSVSNSWVQISNHLSPFVTTTASSSYFLLDVTTEAYGNSKVAHVTGTVPAMWEPVETPEGAHIEGRGNIALGDYQHVGGTYNIADANKALIVGNGTDESHRANALTLDWSGNLVVSGDITTGTPLSTSSQSLAAAINELYGIIPDVSVTQVLQSGTKVATIEVDSTATDIYAPTPTEVSIDDTLSTGTKVATITIDGTDTEILVPSAGSSVQVTQIQDTGTHIADIEVDGVTTELYAPNGGGGAVIDDTVIALDKTWSSSKINSELGALADRIEAIERYLWGIPLITEDDYQRITEDGSERILEQEE